MKPKYTQIDFVVIVGTSHIAAESVKNVQTVIEQFAPCIVGVELDKARFYSLIADQKRTTQFSWQNIRSFGIKGFLFALIASAVTEKLAKIVHAKPGDDMLSAIKTAKKQDLVIALLDQPVHITLRRFSDELTWREKWHFLIDILRGMFFPNREIKRYGLEKFDLKKVPPETLIKKLLAEVKGRYPNVYKVLITERNGYMVRKIRKFQEKYPNQIIVAVVGAGHEEGLLKLLQS